MPAWRPAAARELQTDRFRNRLGPFIVSGAPQPVIKLLCRRKKSAFAAHFIFAWGYSTKALNRSRRPVPGGRERYATARPSARGSFRPRIVGDRRRGYGGEGTGGVCAAIALGP